MVSVSAWVRIRLDYGLGFSSDIRSRQDTQLRVSHLARPTENERLCKTKMAGHAQNELEITFKIRQKRQIKSHM